MYIAHDQGKKESQDRIEFTHTRHLPNTSPQRVAAIMSATAMQRESLKRAAGIRPGGNPAKTLLHHIILSWDQSQSDVSKEEMIRAANGALRYLGLERNQAYMAAHNDSEEGNRHLHIAVSRVDLENGKLIDGWRSHRRLSKWALKYGRETGFQLKGREEAWLARENGIVPPKAKKTTSKDQYELEKSVKRLHEARRVVVLARKSETNPKRRAELKTAGTTLRQQHKEAQKAATARLDLAKKNAQQKQCHEQQRTDLHELYQQRVLHTREEGEGQKHTSRRRIEKATLRWQGRLTKKHASEKSTFLRNEETVIGLIYNRLAYTDWKAVFLRKQETGERGPSILSKAFTALSDVGHRLATMEQRQKREIQDLHGLRKQLQERRELRIDSRTDKAIKGHRVKFGRTVKLFDRLQEKSRSRLKEKWQAFNETRRGITKGARQAFEQTRPLAQQIEQSQKQKLASKPKRRRRRR